MAVTTRRRSKGATAQSKENDPSNPDDGASNTTKANATSPPVPTAMTTTPHCPRTPHAATKSGIESTTTDASETPSKRRKTSSLHSGSSGGDSNTSKSPSTAATAASTLVEISSSSGLTQSADQIHSQTQSAKKSADASNNGVHVQLKANSKVEHIENSTAAANTINNAVDCDEYDSDIEVVSPTNITSENNASSAARNTTTLMSQGDDIQMTSSNLLNPNIHFPHIRQLCGVHPFDSETKTPVNAKHCDKCYCFVCDDLVSKCEHWVGTDRGTMGPHCHAHNGVTGWVQLRESVANSKRSFAAKASAQEDEEVTVLSSTNFTAPSRNPYQNSINQRALHPAIGHRMLQDLISNEFLSRPEKQSDADAFNELVMMAHSGGENEGGRNYRRQGKERKDMRIPEVFLENFRKAMTLHDSSSESNEVNLISPAASSGKSEDGGGTTAPVRRKKIEGDIPSLSLYNTFFMEGIKIGWPFPEVMKPQRMMAMHLIKALKNSRHVVLESPTGTGKSAAILCSVLAWQRHHYKMMLAKANSSSTVNGINGDDGNEGGDKPEKVKIIYCSRTHSQVTQMVASLKSTPYRPRMAILGSRDRLCIHKSIKPRGSNAESISGVNENNECRTRIRNTEKSRKHFLTNANSENQYNDDDPPEDMPGDGDAGGDGEEGKEEEFGANQFIGRKKTCPHYRQLTTARVANLAHDTFVPNGKVDCCSVGGKKTRYGAHDIEDLVNFGVDPNLQNGVALYRGESTQSFGLSLKSSGNRSRGCYIRTVKKGTPAETDGSLKAGDKILRVNGKDVSHEEPANVANIIRDTPADPLVLDITRGGSGTLSSGDGSYSSHSACPYFISRALSKDADIIFAPYNYVLDPGIRASLGIELSGAVVVLDEAHNVEDTLREAGSGKFGEFELCDLVVMLNNFAITERSTGYLLDLEPGLPSDDPGERAYLCDVSHTLLLFVDKVVNNLSLSRKSFEENPGAKGADAALRNWEKFKTKDDTENEYTFDGPTGKGIGGKAVGCLGFFEKLGITKADLDTLSRHVDAFEKFTRGREENQEPLERDKASNLVDRLVELIHKLSLAIQTPEHYYAAVVVKANGSLEFANGGEAGGRFKTKSRALPLIPPRTIANPDRPPNPCLNPHCRAQCADPFQSIRHGSCCDGSTPKWQASLNLNLLTPGPLMEQITSECRTVVLASGSLSPISSLCAELNLFASDEPVSPMRPTATTSMTKLTTMQKRLQVHPKPLEADHVVDLGKQLFSVSIGHFPDGSELKMCQKNYSQSGFLEKLGDSIVKIVEGIPEGGVLIFLPSYALLHKCERVWNPNGNNTRSFWNQRYGNDSDEPSVFNRLEAIKYNVIVEPNGPNGGQDMFEAKKEEYMESVRVRGGCVLLAVFRGKMSEGISFNDNNARGVICIGLPLPNFGSLPIKVKRDYNDEQRKLKHRNDLLPGGEWYQQQAYRAIAQALGRCIRHAADYGAIFLLDIRHCDDGSPNNGTPNAHKNLPKWMRRNVRNLSRSSNVKHSMYNYVSAPNAVYGGWPGLKNELRTFFKNAKPHVAEVMDKQNKKIAAARGKTEVHTFSAKTCNWSIDKTSPPLAPQNASVAENNCSISTTLQQTMLSVNSAPAGKKSVSVVDHQPSRQFVQISSKKNTLQQMFQKQKDMEPAAALDANNDTDGSRKPAASASKIRNKSNSPMNLKAMFEKQRAASTSPSQDMPVAEDASTSLATVPALDPPKGQPNETSNAHTFQKSPFAEDMQMPLAEAASASQMQISQTRSSMESEEHLCVVCEDAKKEVILMPCQHMCLCKNCCNTQIIKECPMCRAEIKDTMVVYW